MSEELKTNDIKDFLNYYYSENLLCLNHFEKNKLSYKKNNKYISTGLRDELIKNNNLLTYFYDVKISDVLKSKLIFNSYEFTNFGIDFISKFPLTYKLEYFLEEINSEFFCDDVYYKYFDLEAMVRKDYDIEYFGRNDLYTKQVRFLLTLSLLFSKNIENVFKSLTEGIINIYLMNIKANKLEDDEKHIKNIRNLIEKINEPKTKKEKLDYIYNMAQLLGIKNFNSNGTFKWVTEKEKILN